MKVSFIIPVINNFKYTKGIYKNLKEYFPEDEIIISDGGSIDETIEYFKDKSDIIFKEVKEAKSARKIKSVGKWAGGLVAGGGVGTALYNKITGN